MYKVELRGYNFPHAHPFEVAADDFGIVGEDDTVPFSNNREFPCGDNPLLMQTVSSESRARTFSLIGEFAVLSVVGYGLEA